MERVERVALADRQAYLCAAAIAGAQEYTPLDVAEVIREWDAWLVSDPADTADGRAARSGWEALGVGGG